MTVFPLSHYPPGLIWVSSQVQNEKSLQLSSLWKSLLRILSVGRNVWYLKIKRTSGEKHLIPPWGKIWIQDCILLPEKTNLQWDTLNMTQVVQMHTVAFSYCAWHTHCTQVGKDRSITVRRRKDAVSCIPCPSAKKKKKSSELNSCESTVHCQLLCSADKMKPQKHWELKFIATHTRREHQESYVL